MTSSSLNFCSIQLDKLQAIITLTECKVGNFLSKNSTEENCRFCQKFEISRDFRKLSNGFKDFRGLFDDRTPQHEWLMKLMFSVTTNYNSD